jgi:hypothetical protein
VRQISGRKIGVLGYSIGTVSSLGRRNTVNLIGDFVECDACAAKTGSPTLCNGCLHNRVAAAKLIQELDKLRVDPRSAAGMSKEQEQALRTARRHIFDLMQDSGGIDKSVRYSGYVGYCKDGEQGRNLFHIIDSALGECKCNWCTEKIH